jgi:nucleotide-binding universal stress UspA family protein
MTMYRLKKILVPTDFSTESRAALEHAVRLATKYEAEITLMHVDEFVVSPLGALGVKADYLDVYQRNKMEFLKEELEKLRRGIGGKCIVQTCVVSGRAYKVIVEESEVRGFDLIVIAARGLTALSEHLIGSTAERVVRLSRQPVLSVRSAPQLDRIESILCPTDLSPTANIALSYALSIALQNPKARSGRDCLLSSSTIAMQGM